MLKIVIVISIALLVAAINGIFLIPLLHKLKFGQEIREEGPKWHKAKSGTPTMGGFIFIIALLIAVIVGIFVFGIYKDAKLLKSVTVITLAAVGFGAIGFVDDYIKVILKRNLGLKAGQKFSLQFLVALLFGVWLVSGGIIDTTVNIPFFTFAANSALSGSHPFATASAPSSVNHFDSIIGSAPPSGDAFVAIDLISSR